MEKSKTSDGHRQRLRDKFLNHGLNKFTDEEIVELLLTLGTPRRDCKQVARRAIKRFGSLSRVLNATGDELQQVEGIGPSNAFGVGLVHAIARKFLRDRLIKENYIDSFPEVLDYFTHILRDKKTESFHVLLLNAQNAILHEELVSLGSPDSVAFTPRQVIEMALNHSATTIVLAHNHPGGDARPSPHDTSFTREMVFTARLLDLWVREHLIIAKKGRYSFRQEGLIDRFETEFANFHKSLAQP